MRMHVDRLHAAPAHYHLPARCGAAGLRLGLRRIHETAANKDYASHRAGHILKKLSASGHSILSGGVTQPGPQTIAECHARGSGTVRDARETREPCPAHNVHATAQLTTRRSVAVGLCIGNTQAQAVETCQCEARGVARSRHNGYSSSESVFWRGDREYGEHQSNRHVE